MEKNVIWTVGHSNRPMAELVGLLTDQSISVLADVRRFPGSKRQPQFAKDSLKSSLQVAGIGYQHFEDLGGRRNRSRNDSTNTGWRSVSFNAYADHMQTNEFQAALQNLMTLAASSPTAILCAEAVPWRCHRQLIADALTAQGWEVRHILGARSIRPHHLTEFAKVVEGHVTYPGQTFF
ncbi:MAG: DUF488 domain-containing protein [Pirellulales bacterium]|nr:DUF488 domain-containing protein [Pirellulales bacterium]